ncbi:type IV pilus assembly protein PilM [Candidatus Parcubacteria bacterium]|nr:MAG: type IV pilus assembly protein PilM [Candidatus Parcubacteria bacterium]
MRIPFLQNLRFPAISLWGFGPASFVGIDVGSDSAKVVQLRKERARAVLETYGELRTGHYFAKDAPSASAGFLGASDESIANVLVDLVREAKVTTRRAVFSIPATASFLTVIPLPLLDESEIAAAVPFEAKKYIPMPTSDVALDWELVSRNEQERRVEVLLAAVPAELIAKYQRVAELAKLRAEAMEIESFSLARSLLMGDRGVSAVINWGAIVTTLSIVDQGRIRANHNFGRGSFEITTALAQTLGVNLERAEAMKREVGLSEKPEERQITEIIGPIVDAALTDIERAMTAYNQRAERRIEKIILTGGGSNLAGVVPYIAKHFDLETAIGNPFVRTVYPAFLEPVLREIAPNFAIATGAALRQITV